MGARILANTLAQRILYLSGDELDPMREVLAELLAHEEVRPLLAGMVTGLDIRYDVGPGGHPLLGRRLPGRRATADSAGDFAASSDQISAPTFEFLHAGRGVVLDLAGNEEACARRGRSVDGPDDVSPPTSRPAGALTDVDAVLVRPDGYLAWIGSGGSGAAGLADALTRWFGRPAASQRIARFRASQCSSCKP